METKVQQGVHRDKKDSVFFNPFPGLRPFGVDESHLFFGREGQSDEVLEKLANHKFAAVLGASGSGKSSLMYCGLLPVLYGGFISEAVGKWHTVITRPGNNPIKNLADALIESIPHDAHELANLGGLSNITETVLRSSTLGLVEAVRQLNRPKGENILILVDQFEELFRFKKSRRDKNAEDESLSFVKLLVNAINQSELPIYIVMTMRSDFIGDCAQFPELTKKINDSHYLIPQMTRENLRDAVVGPVAVGGGKISSRLVDELLNSVGDNPDQLPILQHSLMRTWGFWEKNRIENEPMDLKHYDAIGRMKNALSQHANEAFDELSESEKELCERLFKTLTEKGADNRGIRRPTSVAELSLIAQAEPKDVIAITERFRQQGRTFLTPGAAIDLTEETIIDISHESLMRVWDRLIYWVDEESNSIQMYVRLSNAAALYQEGKSGMWRPPDLQLAVNWRDNHKPNLKWAERFNPAFERSMVFLRSSEEAYDAEELNKIRQQKKALRRTKIFAIILGTAAVIALGIGLYASVLKNDADAKAEEALLAQENAELAKSQADMARQQAEQAKIDAQKNEKVAEQQKLIAQQSLQEAERQKLLAQASATEAGRQKSIALASALEAKEQRKIADEKAKEAELSADEAELQKTIAEKSSKDARNLRMLSIAKSMAVKSLHVNRDTSKKALMALQAYNYNKDYAGYAYDADVYSGLYYGLKMLKPENYNALIEHKDAVRVIEYLKDGTLISAGADGKIVKWSKNGEHQVLAQEEAIIKDLVVDEADKLLVYGTSAGYVKSINWGKSNEIHTLKGKHTGGVVSLNFSEGKIISSSSTGQLMVRFIDETKGEPMTIAYGKVFKDILTKDKQFYGVTSGGSFIRFSVKDNQLGEQTVELPGDSKVNAASFNHSGELMVYGDRKGIVRVVNTAGWSLVNTLEGQNARISELIYSENDDMIAASSFDGTVQVWRTDALKQSPLLLRDHDAWVWSISFNEDGSKIYAGTGDDLIRIYSTDNGVLAEEYCSLLARNMTKKEWEKYVAEDIEYERTCVDLPIGEGIKED